MATRYRHESICVFKMKHYIILTPSISNMGGSEMYTSNKSQYLQKTGWDVRVFYANPKGDIKIDNLRQFKQNCIPEIGFGISYICKKRRNAIVSHICDGISPSDETIVESHVMEMAYWGELIAKHCRAKNILNCMEERIKPFSDNEAAFVEFKLRRMEILNASVKSFHRYFNDRYKDEYSNYTHKFNKVFCSNVIAEDDDTLNLPTDGQSIMSIGRLDKPYIMPMFEEVKKFATHNTDKKYNVLVIGGSPDGSVENEIKNLFAGVDNITLFMYGYVFPVPRNLINKADVGIATANSILVTADQGIPTIAIDIQDFLPMGIFGRTTNNKFSRDDEPIRPISTWLKDILNEGKYPKVTPSEMDVDAELERVFDKQVHFLNLSPNDHQYYDVLSVYSCLKFVFNQLKYKIINFTI